MLEYIFVSQLNEYESAMTLFVEYSNWLNIDLSFQKFAEELKILKTMYGDPFGCIILCKHENDFVGCVAVRKIDDGVAELKRMYVKPEFQRMGIGENLLKMSISFAKEKRYKTIKLDTLNTMKPAMNLYAKHGFVETSAYYFNPELTAVYFELKAPSIPQGGSF
jgi:ribosomal protein S18 acetylase RimI-like enzyme